MLPMKKFLVPTRIRIPRPPPLDLNMIFLFPDGDSCGLALKVTVKEEPMSGDEEEENRGCKDGEIMDTDDHNRQSTSSRFMKTEMSMISSRTSLLSLYGCLTGFTCISRSDAGIIGRAQWPVRHSA